MRNLILLLFLLSLSMHYLFSQSMFVKEISNEQTEFSISDIQNITFTNGEIQIKKNNGLETQYLLSEIRYINFINLSISISENTLNVSTLLLYPNPAINEINLTSDFLNNENHKISIIDIQGRCYFEENFYGKSLQNIDISNLQSGIYFCIIKSKNNNIIKKFIKN